MTNTLPKPVLAALVYRLTILLGAARVLPSIGADSWEADYGVDDGWDGRPVSTELAKLDNISKITSDLEAHTYTLNVSSVHSGHRLFTSPS